MPILVVYAITELRRGWKVLKYGEPSLNIALQARIWLLGLIQGKTAADRYRMSLLTDSNTMAKRGVYSLVEGLILLMGCIILIISWLL